MTETNCFLKYTTIWKDSILSTLFINLGCETVQNFIMKVQQIIQINKLPFNETGINHAGCIILQSE